MEFKSTYEELSYILEAKEIDEFDILDPIIFEYYKEEQRDLAEFSSDYIILIDKKLGLSRDIMPELFKICQP